MQVSKYLKQYRIPFSGLAAGKHEFDFEIDDKFFDCYEHSLVKKGKLKADVELQKQENMLVVNFHIYGMIQLSCDSWAIKQETAVFEILCNEMLLIGIIFNF